MSDEIQKLTEQEFQIPEETIKEIYDISGDSNIKGMFLCVLDEKGELKFYEKFSHSCIEKSFLFDLVQYCRWKESFYNMDDHELEGDE